MPTNLADGFGQAFGGGIIQVIYFGELFDGIAQGDALPGLTKFNSMTLVGDGCAAG